ncbi:MAG TPA: metallophosphoesterase, partial [Clostridiales bacterium]|nr:metallophosphoesterase [Clostridiales bacterium]
MNGELKFYLITDTHHYAVKDLGYSEHQDQKCLNETGAILDAAFEKFAAQSEIDIVLIAGDLSNNGEMASHLELIEKLNKLQQAGKRVYLITATHDYTYRPDGEQEGKTAVSEGGTSRAMLRGLYEAFGFREAIAEYLGDNLSYVVQLAPGYRLLCLNDDGNGRSYCGYDDSHLAWILDQIKAAR